MIELHAFGSFDLRDDDRPLYRALSQPKRAALLAYLVLARPRELHRRDTLVALLWPELDQVRARSALSQSLTFLRRRLPDGVLVTRGVEEVGVDVGRVRCDVVAFEAAVAEERWADALGLYRGPLLQGLHVPGARPFAEWLELERERLRELAAKAAWRSAHQNIATGALTEAERVAQQALCLVPTDESPVRAFIEALAGAGDRAAALRFYERFVTVLAEELEVEPAPETVAVMEAVRGRSEPAETVFAAAPLPSRPAVTATVERGARPRRRQRSRAIAILAAAGVAVMVAVFGLDMLSGRQAVADSGVRTVVVLPVHNLSGDSTQQYLAEGMKHALIVSLTRIQALKVVSSLTADASPDEIAHRFGADTLIESSLVRDGDRVRVTAELTRGTTGEVLWSASYDRDLSDVLTLQAEIARAIADQVDVALTSQDEERLARASPRAPTPGLVDAIMRVRYLLSGATPENLRQATRLLEQALDVAPDFAPAWSALGTAYLRQALWFSGAPMDSVMPLADRAIRRALALDPDDLDARTDLAALDLFRWRWEEAERGYREVLERIPTHWLASVALANLLTAMGRYDEAEAFERRIIAVDPLFLPVHAELFNTLAQAGKYDEAGQVLAHIGEIEPAWPLFRHFIPLTLAFLGHCQDSGNLFPADLGIGGAVAEADRLVEDVCGDVPYCLFLASHACMLCGERDRAVQLFNRVEAMARTRYVSAVDRARFHVEMGDNEGAIDLLEVGLRNREIGMMGVANSYWYRSLRGDPRFESIVDRVGLPRAHRGLEGDAGQAADSQAEKP